MGPDPPGAVFSRAHRAQPPRRRDPAAPLAGPPRALGADADRPYRQRVPLPPDGIRRRPLRGADGRGRLLLRDYVAIPPDVDGRAGRVRRPELELAAAPHAGQL